MKTVFEYQAEQQRKAFRSQAQSIEAFLQVLPEPNDEALSVRKTIRSWIDQASFSHLACDDCGSALIYNPSRMLPSDPPKWRHFCPGCGRTYRLT